MKYGTVIGVRSWREETEIQNTVETGGEGEGKEKLYKSNRV